MSPAWTFHEGKSCVKCGSRRRNRYEACADCAARRSKKHDPIKKAAYARTYRRTEKGREVNRNGQVKSWAKRKAAEGSHTTEEWVALKEQYHNHCLRCDKHQSELDRVLEQDHVIPLSRGGTNWITNIQPLCHECNGMGGKGTKHIDYREKYATRTTKSRDRRHAV